MLKTYIENQMQRWSNEAEHAIIRIMAKGEFESLVSQRWANGVTMTGPRGGLANRFIPRERAVALFKYGRENNWKWIVDESGRVIV